MVLETIFPAVAALKNRKNSTKQALMPEILLVSALPAEQIRLSKEIFHTATLISGIGKVAATYALTRALQVTRPDLVLNVGSAGTLHFNPGDVLVCRNFVDRNLLGLELNDTPSRIENTVAETYCLPPSIISGREDYAFRAVCATGDSFVTTEAEACGDVVDMEAFAQAYVCKKFGVDFLSVKCVTDVVGKNSLRIWEERLADAQQTLEQFFEKYAHILAKNHI